MKFKPPPKSKRKPIPEWEAILAAKPLTERERAKAMLWLIFMGYAV
jgi:hypothetical protein